MSFISGPSTTPGTEQVHNEEKEQVNPFMIWPLFTHLPLFLVSILSQQC